MTDSFDGGRQLTDEDRRIINILKEVGDELDNDPRIKSIIREVAKGSVASLPYNVFTQLIREFVALVVSSTKVSAETLEKIVRIFIKMWRGPELSSKVLQEMYPGTSVDDPDTVDGVYIPPEITLMSDEFIENYKQVLMFGQQKVKSIRLMVVGMFGIGKTSLIENLVQREGNTEREPPKSTVGIDVTHCNIRDGEWIENIFDDNTCGKFLEVMQNSSSSDAPDDDVDAGYETYPNEVVPMQDEDANKDKILHKMTATVQAEDNSKDIESPTTEEVNTETEELKLKLTKAKDDNPELHAFATDLHTQLKSNFKPHNPIDSTISIWDFAGQYIYYSTHHFFLNSRSIYLLMMDISTPLGKNVKETSDFPLSDFLPQDFTCLDAFKFWLNSIHMYSTRVEAEIKPSVILIGTKKDELEGTDEEKEKQKDVYFDKALKSLKSSPALKHVHPKKFLINNLDKNEDFRKIREEVVMLAQEHRYWGELRPARWITLERSFLGLKSRGKEIITFDEVKEKGEKSEIPILKETELRFFLRFQHQLGNILYYETDTLKNHVILSPQWIIGAFKCFITHVKDKDPTRLSDWDDYEKKAILTQELINKIFDNTKGNFRDYKEQVIEYMEHLDMIAKPIDVAIYEAGEIKPVDTFEPGYEVGQRKEMTLSVDVRTSTAEKKDTTPVHFYIVPSLLKLRPEHTRISELINDPPHCTKKTPILCFKFTNNFMPPSVFHRLLAVCIKRWSIIVPKSKSPLLFNGFAVFSVSDAGELTIWFHDHIIYARVSFCSTDVEKSIPQKIRKILTQHLTEILRILPKESRISEVLPFEEYIQCSCVEEYEKDAGLLRISNFFTQDKVYCRYDHSHEVRKDEAIGMWCYTSIQNQQNTKIPDTALDRKPTAKELARVSQIIGNEYRQLMNELGLEQAKVEQIKDNYKGHPHTQKYHMLCEWQTKFDGPVRQLRNALVAVDSKIVVAVDSKNVKFDEIFVSDQFESTCIDMEKLGEIDLKRKPSDVEIVEISDRIGADYWLLGVELGIGEVQLQHHREDNKNSMATTVKCILNEWNQSDGDIEYLGKAMYLADSNMKAYYKVFSKK